MLKDTHKNKKQLKVPFYTFLFSLLTIVFFIIIHSIIFQKNLNSNLMSHAYEILSKKNLQLKDILKEQENLLYSIKNSTHFNEYMKNPKNEIDNMNEFFSIITSNQKNIMQLRFIDKNGQERIKISKNSINSSPVINFPPYLENKAYRYYFKNSIAKPTEKVWFSNLDLSVKNGEIQVPYKATLRAVLPVLKDNKFEGILVVNYFMDDVINNLFKSTFFDMILINKKGYSLIHYNDSKSWGFYQEPKTTIKNQFQNSYDEIISGNLIVGEHFISKKLDVSTLEQLILIVKIKESFSNQQHSDNKKQYLYVSAIVIVVALLISFVFSNYLDKLFNRLENSLKINKSLDEKLTDIIENINDFVWEVDEEWRYTYVSPQVKEILGFTPEEVIGKTAFDFMSKEEAVKIKKNIEKNIKNKDSIIQQVSINLHKDTKKEIYIESSAKPILSENGEILGYRGTNRDITHKIAQENKIKLINKQLEEVNLHLEDKIKEEVQKNKLQEERLFNQAKMAAMGDMIGNIAHQWRQPLNYISVVASGIRLDKELGNLKEYRLSEDMQDIVEKTQYLSKTIDTFRNFLKEKKEYEEVIIQSRINIALNIVEASIKDNHIDIINNIDYIVPVKCFIVKSELAEVIINILNNAKDALIENEIEQPWIKLNLEHNEEYITITIEDNAGGIPKDIIDRVFEPYFTTKDAVKGTGLGLYMSYKIVTESLRGKIYVENSEDGAKFFLEIPRKKQETTS